MIYFEDIRVGDVTDHGTCDVTREEMIEFASNMSSAAIPSF